MNISPNHSKRETLRSSNPMKNRLNSRAKKAMTLDELKTKYHYISSPKK